ncbi:unnamed protein product [Aureobasidium uvarum]|uniref:BTB domain-containing protein n=1 Tax=Aureobasidium uvarum TaxID=2773716 RepID=A0A9N8KCD5_9PEZI|nr:unnamed protein product [Aureobasidium uvarum]
MSSRSVGSSKGAVSISSKFPSRKYFSGLVTIVVGPSKKNCTVHKELLSFYSDYFRAAFNGSFVEASDKKVELHDVQEEVFENSHAWLYTRTLASSDDKALDWHPLNNLWIFGDRFQIPMLQNCVIDEMFHKRERENVFSLAIAKIAYENTPVGSPLHKAIVNIIAHRSVLREHAMSIMTAAYSGCYTIELLQDVIMEIDAARMDKLPQYKMPKRDKCFFHVHGKDEHC